MLLIEWKASADADLFEILDYISERNEQTSLMAPNGGFKGNLTPITTNSIRGWLWQDRLNTLHAGPCESPHPDLPPKAGRRKSGILTSYGFLRNKYKV